MDKDKPSNKITDDQASQGVKALNSEDAKAWKDMQRSAFEIFLFFSAAAKPYQSTYCYGSAIQVGWARAWLAASWWRPKGLILTANAPRAWYPALERWHLQPLSSHLGLTGSRCGLTEMPWTVLDNPLYSTALNIWLDFGWRRSRHQGWPRVSGMRLKRDPGSLIVQLYFPLLTGMGLSPNVGLYSASRKTNKGTVPIALPSIPTIL